MRRTGDSAEILSTESLGDGKISLHGSGMTAIRPHNDPKGHQLVIGGNHLLNKEKNQIGARHLYSIFMKQPHFKPENSPAFNRDSDYALESKDDLKPFILVFFALPRHGLSVNFNFNLHVDEMESIPNDFLGLHGFSLRYHDVFWFAYRTKHMEKWTKQAQICYHDGFTIPIFVGTGPGQFRLEFREPEYILKEKELEIRCLGSYPDSV